MCSDVLWKLWTNTKAWPAFCHCVFWVMLHFTDVFIPGCNVPLSLWKSVIIALAAAIWDGLKLRAWEQCIIKVGHAEKSRAVPKDGSGLKTGAGWRVTHFRREVWKKDDQESTGYGSANCALTAGYCCHFMVLDRFMTILISNCSCGAKNGGLFAELRMSVAQGRYRGGGWGVVQVLQILGLFWENWDLNWV